MNMAENLGGRGRGSQYTKVTGMTGPGNFTRTENNNLQSKKRPIKIISTKNIPMKIMKFALQKAKKGHLGTNLTQKNYNRSKTDP